MKRILIAAIILIGALLDASAKYGPSNRYRYYSFQDESTGLYGIKYDDELVMLPSFEHLEGEGYEPVFHYKQDGKWGVFTLQGFITPPIFDEIKNNSRYSLRFVYGRVDNKWYLIENDGIIPLPVESEEMPVTVVLEKADKKENAVVFVLKPLNGEWTAYTPGGVDLLNGKGLPKKLKSDINDLNYNDGAKKTFKKALSSFVKQAKKDPELMERLFLTDDQKKIFESGLVYKSKKLNDTIPSVPIEIAGYKGVINELGINDIPVRYQYYKDILKWSPNNIYSLERQMDDDLGPSMQLGFLAGAEEYEEYLEHNANRSYRRALMYAKLTEMALEQGFDVDSPLVERLKQEASKVHSMKSKLDKIVADNEKSRASRARIDAIGNSLIKAIGTMSEALGASSTTSAAAPQSDVSSSRGGAKQSSATKTAGDKYDVSEQMRCNADKSVYGRYESMISKAKTNGTASPRELMEWRSKMKALREKWEAKGYSFPHSSLE